MTSPKVPEEQVVGSKVVEGQYSVQTTDVGDTQSGFTATASLDESAVANTWQGVPDFPFELPSGKMGLGCQLTPPVTFPRIISAADIVEAFDDAFTCSLLPWEEELGSLHTFILQEWGLGSQEEPQRRRKDRRNDEAARRGLQSLIAPPGDLEGENQKFICVFQVGLEDDEEFCLVKRILGKAGNNMRRIADECNAKVRLRGIGSGFLEGSDGCEANMPLQLNVSCTDYSDYVAAVDQVASLLKDLYKHYRRYARSKGMEPPDVRLSVDEVRRDDLRLDQLAAKANRTSMERERDRLDRRERAAAAGAVGMSLRGAGDFGPRQGMDDSSSDSSGSVVEDEWRSRMLTLPSGAPMPTTPAGRRAAARTGGAAAAAAVSAAAREAEREERERNKVEKERKRREAEEKAAAQAKRPGRNAPRGMGLLTRSAGDAQQLLPDGQLPIGANTAPTKVGGKGKGKKNKGKGRGRQQEEDSKTDSP